MSTDDIIRNYLDSLGEYGVGIQSARARALWGNRDRFIAETNGAEVGTYWASFGSAYSETMEHGRELVAGRRDLDDADALELAPFVNMLEWFPNGYTVRFGWVKADADHWDQWGRQAFTVSGGQVSHDDPEGDDSLLTGIGKWADRLSGVDHQVLHLAGVRPDDETRQARARQFRGKMAAWERKTGESVKCGRFLPGEGSRFKRDEVRARFDAAVASGREVPATLAKELAEAERKVRSQVPVFVPANRSERPFGTEAQWSKIMGANGDRQVIVIAHPSEGFMVLDCFREAVGDADTWEAMAGRAPAKRFTRKLRNGDTKFSGPTLWVPAFCAGTFDSADDAEECARKYASQIKLDQDCDSDGYGTDANTEVPLDPHTALVLREAEAAAQDWTDRMTADD